MTPDRPSENRHRVLTARFEFAGADEAVLLDTRARIADAAEGGLPAALSHVFDQTAGPDEMLEIDRLEVDLGLVDPGALDLGALAAATRKALARITPSKTHAPGRSVGHGAAADSDGLTDSGATAHARPFAEAALEAAVVYLMTGRLTPSTANTPLAYLFDAIAVTPETVGRLLAALRHAPAQTLRAALIRLLAAADPSFVAALLEMAHEDALEMFGDIANFEREAMAARRTSEGLAALAGRLLRSSVFANAPPEDDGDAAQADLEPATVIEVEDTTAAPNAGVVLLHPFFPRLFGNCGLMDGRDFRDEDAQATATRLVHYLATGDVQAEEPVLLIPRLLCAVRPELPVLSPEPLEPGLTDRADALLTAAIGHWARLGNTSPDGLRETFLSRPGLLKGKPERPRIVVEHRGVDVLIGSLPWALTPIRLPWMPVPVSVEWA